MARYIEDDDEDELQFLGITVIDGVGAGEAREVPSYHIGAAPIQDFQPPQGFRDPSQTESPQASSVDVLRYNRDDSLSFTTDFVGRDAISETVSETDFAHVQDASDHMTVDLPLSTLVQPRSLALNFEPPATWVEEDGALGNLLQHIDAAASADIEIDLSDFSIYVDTLSYPSQLRSLHYLATTRHGHSCMYFDGVLSVGDARYFVRKVPFRELPIGNYGSEVDTVGDQIWIRSRRNEKGGRFKIPGSPPIPYRRENIYYRLVNPSIEYSRYYEPFLWVANLGKHFADFCKHTRDEHRPVSIHDFEFIFSDWLHETHGSSPNFQQWHGKLGRLDYRSSIVANVEYLWKEACSILSREAHSLDVFREIHSFRRFIPVGRPLAEDEIQKTVVTPYTYRCFGHMNVGVLLEPIESSTAASGEDDIHVLKKPSQLDAESASIDRLLPEKVRDCVVIKPGDVISTHPDPDDSDTKWKGYTASSDRRWYALVQKVSTTRQGTRVFDVTWFYHPCDTPCGAMKYPWGNELFLSNHCTCDEGNNVVIREDEVLGIHTVEWFGRHTTSAEFFVRQVYLSDERRWVTLKKEHLVCDHSTKKQPVYRTGDTVLVSTMPGELLQPFIVDHPYTQDGKDFVHLRRLLRRTDVESADGHVAKPNELVLLNQFTTVKASDVVGRCLIRGFAKNEEITTPYDRGGVGNAFCLTHKEVYRGSFTETEIVPLEPGEAVPFRQGFDPTKDPGRRRRRRKLQGLDLFCGFGNLGRGLEDGGAVEVRWANDIWDKAIHTHMANARSPDAIRPFLGPVDELLRRALEGKFSQSVPSPGEVEFISGGSPCPGFSLLTNDKTSLKQVKNRSLVASFASFVDFYRPKYGVLENVVTMVPKSGQPEDLFSQLICALVGMGYQTEIMLGRAWSYGAPQTRDRVFLYFAAPGLRLPAVPRPSHCDADTAASMKKLRLGTLSNDEPFVAPNDDAAAAFKIVTAAEATADLPDVGDAQVDICVPFPDHRLSSGVTAGRRPQIINIPTQPYGMGFAKAWADGKGVMTPAERDCYPRDIERVRHRSRAWMRVSPNHLFSTVTTSCAWADARVGRALHWQQQRPLTVMEARRAQGVPDNEVLLGRTPEQWRLVGNAVARQVAVALGLAFHEAWFGSLYEGDDDDNDEREDEEEEEDSVLDNEEEVVGLDGPLSHDDDAQIMAKLSAKSSPPTSVPRPIYTLPPPPIIEISDSDSDVEPDIIPNTTQKPQRPTTTGFIKTSGSDSDLDLDMIRDSARRSRRSATGSSRTTRRFAVLSYDSSDDSDHDTASPPPPPPSERPASSSSRPEARGGRSTSRSTPGSAALGSVPPRLFETPATSDSEATNSATSTTTSYGAPPGGRSATNKKKRSISRSLMTDTVWKRSRSEASPDVARESVEEVPTTFGGKSVVRLPVIGLDD